MDTPWGPVPHEYDEEGHLRPWSRVATTCDRTGRLIPMRLKQGFLGTYGCQAQFDRMNEEEA